MVRSGTTRNRAFVSRTVRSDFSSVWLRLSGSWWCIMTASAETDERSIESRCDRFRSVLTGTRVFTTGFAKTLACFRTNNETRVAHFCDILTQLQVAAWALCSLGFGVWSSRAPHRNHRTLMQMLRVVAS